jgi:hypothetical protein
VEKKLGEILRLLAKSGKLEPVSEKSQRNLIDMKRSLPVRLAM